MQIFTIERPAQGTLRTRSRFAWVPTVIGNNIYWLQKYEVLQVYDGPTYVVKMIVDNEPKDVAFTKLQWITLSKRTPQ